MALSWENILKKKKNFIIYNIWKYIVRVCRHIYRRHIARAGAKFIRDSKQKTFFSFFNGLLPLFRHNTQTFPYPVTTVYLKYNR